MVRTVAATAAVSWPMGPQPSIAVNTSPARSPALRNTK
jgi:hypothetical protein